MWQLYGFIRKFGHKRTRKNAINGAEFINIKINARYKSLVEH